MLVGQGKEVGEERSGESESMVFVLSCWVVMRDRFGEMID